MFLFTFDTSWRTRGLILAGEAVIWERDDHMRLRTARATA